jgi:hypothetical protein
VRSSSAYGVLKLTLHQIHYEWQFVPAAGSSFTDSGAEFCDQGYARPRGATPVNLTFVPAFDQCTSSNASHGSPLSVASCRPPRLSSQHLTVGTPDLNGKAVGFTGHLALKALGESPINLGNGDQADVSIKATFTDVRRAASPYADYTGQLQGQLVLRLTDRLNGAGADKSATAMDVPLSFTIPCQTTASTTIGSTCSVVTSADGVTAGLVAESKRAIWELRDAKVFDGGADGVASTAPNTLFAAQGFFAP